LLETKKRKRKERFLLTRMKRTINRIEIFPPRVFALHRGFLFSQRANAQFTITTNLPLSYPSFPIYI